MRLLKLTIHNIASIENAVIDFENSPLAEDTRFLICGPLGSGKTTILDSICLALYNTTPRLRNATNESYTDFLDDFKTARDDGSVGIDDSRMLMRRGSVRAYSELVFTDRNDNVLTALWSCSKAREKADGKIQDVKWILYDDSGNEITSKRSETEKEIISRTGLTFEQFSRTTMLAQGDFTRFLKARDSDKSEILEKLTGTEIYSRISISIQKTMAAKKDTLIKKESEMSGIVLMPDNVRNEAEARIAMNMKVQSGLSEEEERLKGTAKMLDRIAELTESLQRCSLRKDELTDEYLRLSSGLAFLQDYVHRQENILEIAEAFIGSEKERAGIYFDIEKLKILLSNALKAQKERLAHLADAAGIKEETGRLESSAVKLAEQAAEAAECDVQMGKKLEEARRVLAGTDMESLLKRKDGIESYMSGLKEFSELRQAFLKAESDCARLAEQTECEARQMDMLEKKAVSLDTATSDAEKAYRLQEKIYEAKETACGDILKEIRSRLHEGETCPLCGQHISHLTRDEEFESVLEPERIKKAALYNAYETARHNADKNRASIEELKKTVANSAGMSADAKKAYENALLELSSHTLHTLFAREKDIEGALQGAYEAKEEERKQIAAKILEAIAMQKAADALQIQKDRTLSEVKKAEEKKENAIRLIAEKKVQAAAMMQAAERMEGEYKTNIDTADEMLAAIPDWKAEWAHSPENFVGKICADAQKYVSECEKATKIRHNLKLTDSVYNAVAACRAQVLELYPEWKDCPPMSPARADSLQDRWNRLFADTKSLSDRKKSAEQELSELLLKAKATGIEDIPKASEETAAKLEDVREAYRKCSMEIGADKEKLANDTQLRERLGKLAGEAGIAREEYLQWHRLYEIFGSSDGKKFRNIAQSYVLRQLLAGANGYLRHLTDRYELEGQPGSLTILLKDKEAGGVLRPTSTISGGESFLTSLALALGLSSLSNRNTSMDILFIDEGFGTLDSTYLGTVMDALERLHQMGGRKIGIISHVESLKERLTTQIQVRRINSTLSRIEVKSIL